MADVRAALAQPLASAPIEITIVGQLKVDAAIEAVAKTSFDAQGLRGAAEYEILINRKSVAVRGMDPQSVAHMLIITLIVLSNILYFAAGGKSKIGAGK